MKKETTYRVIKVVFFLLIVILVFIKLTEILYEKCYFNIHLNSPETENWDAFYEEPENSIDVIFLGSSHVYNDFSPAVFYEETGLTAFNMASSNQDLFLSYTYLQAALERQKPKYVFLETSRFCKGVFATPYYYYMSFDAMKWTKTKVDALKTWKSYCPEESMIDRVFTLITYHTRYNELTRVDFSGVDKYSSTQNGYIPSYTIKEVNKSEYDIYDGIWGVPETTGQYIDKICNLCIDNDIELIFVLNPDTESRYGISYSIAQAAANRDVLFLDYNETERFESIGLDCSKDFKDAGHLNIFGAEKFTKRLAADLMEIGVLSYKDNPSDKWAEEEKEWERARDLGRLKTCTDIYEYLELLEKFDEYTVFVASSGDASGGMTDELSEKLQKYGVDFGSQDLTNASVFSYKNGEKVKSRTSKGVISEKGKLPNGQFYTVTSVGNAAIGVDEKKARASVMIGQDEYSTENKGLFFLIYDVETETVVDRVCFATNLQTLDASRD